MIFYMADGDEQRGPFTIEELAARRVRPDTLVWHEGMAEWDRADTVEALRPILFGPDGDDDATGEIPLAPAFVPLEADRPPPPPAAAGFTPATPALQYRTAYSAGDTGAPSTLAVASMTLGILAVPMSLLAMCLWWVSGPMAITAVILGHLGRASARRGHATGEGMALAGLICGYVALGITAFFVLTWVSYLV